MKQPLVSIIIPIYNSQNYLNTLFNSLSKQTYHNYEVICVDDGSTDSSADMVKEYMKFDSRIMLTQQSNGGGRICEK